MGSISKFMNMFGAVRSADHLNGEWAAGEYQLDEGSETSDFDSLPAMFVDCHTSSAVAQLNWVPLPSCAPIASCAYMLSTRRI